MRMPSHAFLVTTAFISFSGCAIGPDYEPPAVTVPEVFRTASSTPAVASAPMTADFVRWWQVLHDPQLNWLIEQAIASNPDIEIALTRVQEEPVQLRGMQDLPPSDKVRRHLRTFFHNG